MLKELIRTLRILKLICVMSAFISFERLLSMLGEKTALRRFSREDAE